MNKYGKRYGTKEEYLFRLKKFIENYHIVMDHNSIHADEDGFTMELNMFADFTQEEFKDRLGLLPKAESDGKPFAQSYGENKLAPPKTWDWRDKGAVTAVKD